MDPVQPEASVVQTGLGIRYVGEHCYAYSGVVQDASSATAATTVLDFTSGSGYIHARIDLVSDAKATADRFLNILLNDESVINGAWDNDPAKSLSPVVKLIIPPFTRFVLKWGCSATKNVTISLTGRVYGVE